MGYATTSHLWFYDSHLSGAVDVSSVEEASLSPVPPSWLYKTTN